MRTMIDDQRRCYPRWPEKFKRRAERLEQNAKQDGFYFHIPPILMLEVTMLSECYHGGRWRHVWKTFTNALWHTWNDFAWSLRIKICDLVGWTKLYHYPQTDEMLEHWQRHGRKCSGSPNCGNIRCIQDSVPNWFRTVTRWPEI